MFLEQRITFSTSPSFLSTSFWALMTHKSPAHLNFNTAVVKSQQAVINKGVVLTLILNRVNLSEQSFDDATEM